MIISESPEMRKKYPYLIIHLDMMFNMGIFSAFLWLNIPGIGGPIAGIAVIALIILYPFVAFNKHSRLNMRIDEIIHRINMRSLTWFKKKHRITPIKTSEDD